jgi:hypothetical protein
MMPCDAICDPTVTRQFDQTSGRFNQRAAFADAAAMDGFNLMFMQFQATAQNLLEQNGLANTVLQLRSIQGQPGTP